jgi:hypothetical protein
MQPRLVRVSREAGALNIINGIGTTRSASKILTRLFWKSQLCEGISNIEMTFFVREVFTIKKYSKHLVHTYSIIFPRFYYVRSRLARSCNRDMLLDIPLIADLITIRNSR